MRAAFLVFVLLWPLAAASAGTASDPADYIRTIYRGYQGRADPPAWFSHSYSPRLRQLIAADQAEAKGEVGRIDFDPIINGQDWKIAVGNARLAHRRQSRRASAVHQFRHGRRPALRHDPQRRALADRRHPIDGQTALDAVKNPRRRR
jgi:hypothetical protein